ncbi:MAG: GGDEF domain-containing protein [Lachnospiraceae bacterium]|nr:GGDEF domain-containing protein [Lachnospiraceae bacterium]
MGLFQKKYKASYMDLCQTPFVILRLLMDEQGNPADLLCTYANLEIANIEHETQSSLTGMRFSQKHGDAAVDWARMLYPCAFKHEEVKCRMYIETLGIVAQITAFPIEEGVVGMLLQDHTSLVRRTVKGIAGREVGIFYYDIAKDVMIVDRSMMELFQAKSRYEGLLSSFAMERIDETYVDLLRSQLALFPGQSQLIEANLKLKSGQFVHLSLSADPTEPEGSLAVGYLEDVTHAPSFAEQAERDTLTGLFHAVSAKERIDEAIMSCYESGRIDAMLLLDLDHFDRVNGTAGYEAGDEMLKKVAEVLKNNFKGKDILARPGGDSFIVYVSDLNDKRAALQISRTLNKLVTQTIQDKEGEPIRITASIGVAFACDNGGNYEKLYKNAEAAMYETKANGRNGYTLA